MKNFDFKDDIIVITGALGQIGQHLVKNFLDSNARVIGIDVKSEPKEDYVDILRLFEDNTKAKYFKTDILNKECLDKINKDVSKEWGHIYGLINNAAIDFPPNSKSPSGKFEDMDMEMFKKVMEINVTGTVTAAMSFGKSMVQANRGSIINIGSIYGMISPDQNIYEYKRMAGNDWFKPSSYSVSKSAIYNLTRYLCVYWGSKNIRVNTISPAGVFNGQEEEFLDGYLPKVPLGRMASPQDICNSTLFLMSDFASYISGHNLVVDGGYTAM